MKKITLLILAASPAVIFAHPGHGASDGISLWHYVSAAEHAIPLVMVVGILLYLAFRYRKTAKHKI